MPTREHARIGGIGSDWMTAHAMLTAVRAASKAELADCFGQRVAENPTEAKQRTHGETQLTGDILLSRRRLKLTRMTGVCGYTSLLKVLNLFPKLT